MIITSLIRKYGTKTISLILRDFAYNYPHKRSSDRELLLEIADDIEDALKNYAKDMRETILKDDNEEEEE